MRRKEVIRHRVIAMRHWSQKLRSVLGSYRFCFCLIFLCAFALNGTPVPNGNECEYLLVMKKSWNPQYLLNDWTFAGAFPAHAVFNFVMGSLTLLLPLEWVGWLGRLICWTIIIIGLLKIGQSYRIPLWMISVSIIFWLSYGQSLVADSYMIGGFEAKSISYGLLLFAIVGFMEQRESLPAILMGLSFSFHPSVGTFGVVSIVFSLLIVRYPLKGLLRILGLGLLAALPGLFAVVPFLLGSSESGSSEAIRFFSLARIPHHVDVFTFSKRDVLTLYLLLSFNWLHYGKNSDDQKIRFMILFQISLAIIFTLGIVSRATELFTILNTLPFRLFPIFVLLLFFFHLMHAIEHRKMRDIGKGALLVGTVALLGLQNPLGSFVDDARRTYQNWTTEQQGLERALKWTSEYTPNGSILISPPWEKNSYYLSERAQIANWNAARYDRLAEWRDRLEALVGKISRSQDLSVESMDQRYHMLTQTQIDSIVLKYGGDYLISKAQYNYPILCESESYKVYQLESVIPQFDSKDD